MLPFPEPAPMSRAPTGVDRHRTDVTINADNRPDAGVSMVPSTSLATGRLSRHGPARCSSARGRRDRFGRDVSSRLVLPPGDSTAMWTLRLVGLGVDRSETELETGARVISRFGFQTSCCALRATAQARRPEVGGTPVPLRTFPGPPPSPGGALFRYEFRVTNFEC